MHLAAGCQCTCAALSCHSHLSLLQEMAAKLLARAPEPQPVPPNAPPTSDLTCEWL